MHGLDGSSQNLEICGASILMADARPDAKATNSWTNEGFFYKLI